MRGIIQFETSDLNSIMAWYLTGRHSIMELREALNARLREKAEQECEMEDGFPLANRNAYKGRPNCF